MKGQIVVIAVIVGYLFGSISFARIVFALLRPGVPPDLLRTPTTDGETELVSHAVGATNVMMVFGPRWGMLTMTIDLLKAFVPTLVFGLMFPGQPYNLVCATAVLAGHVWPVWYGFSGGGGNSSILGMLLAISPLALVVTQLGGYVVGRFVPMFAYLAGVALTIPWFAWRDGLGSPEMLFAVAITTIYFLGQLPEVLQARRLIKAGHRLDVEHTMRLMKRAAKRSSHDAGDTEDVAERAG